jgi:hypothetical protein
MNQTNYADVIHFDCSYVHCFILPKKTQEKHHISAILSFMQGIESLKEQVNFLAPMRFYVEMRRMGVV